MRNSVLFPPFILFFVVLVMKMATSSVFSQDSKPGIGGVFTSEEKVIWLRAEDLSSGFNNNDPVNSWPDFSESGNDAIQENATHQPVFVANGGNDFNNRPVVRFNGNSHFMEIADTFNLNNMDGLTILFVMKLNGTGTQAFLTKRADHDDQNRFGFLYHKNKFRFDVESVSQESDVSLDTSSSVIISGMFNGNLSGNQQFVFRNGAQAGSRTNNNTAIGTNSEPVRLGRFNDGDNRNLDGDVAEVLMYRTGLNNAQRLIVENVLAIKYGLDIGAHQMFASGDFDHDIIGVGTTDGLQKHSETTGGGGGLYLSEFENGFNEVNEFVFAGHDGTEHGIETSGLGNLEEVDDRWNRVWRIERRTNGYVDTGNTPVKMTFDFDVDDDLVPSYDNVYVLLYKDTESATDFTMVPSVFASVADNQATFSVPDEGFKTGYYTIGRYTGDASEFMIKTWTSQGTGNWNDSLMWKDQNNVSGTPNMSTTSEYDNIVIKSGHTITITEDDYMNNDLFIEVGGRLNIGSKQGHHWSTIRGQGRIRIMGDYFPGGNATQFISAGGGITEYYGSSFTIDESRTFNHLDINLSSLASSITLKADLNINGNFHIDKGTFYINDTTDTSRRITVKGNVRIAETTNSGQHVKLVTGTGNAQHFFTIRGNLTVNAETRFANLTEPSYSSTPDNGYVQTIFNHPTQDQTAQINARTEFYRIEINKGVDKTYSLQLKASEPDLFYLWGRTDQNQGGTPPNRSNNNSLGLLAGTVIIGDHIEIEQLRNASGQNYDIDQDAQIVVEGGRLLAPSGKTLAIVVYGQLTLERGYLEAMGIEGVTIREFGTFEVNDGEAKLHIVRTSVISGIHRGAYVQEGGIVNVLGSNGNQYHFRFSFPYSTNSFTMTGGTLNIRKPKTNNPAQHGGILIGAHRDNILVSGGTVNAYIDNDRNFIINSSAPFYNLNLIREYNNANREFLLSEYAGGGPVPAQPKRPLEVINKLEIIANPYNARLNLNGGKAIIHGDFLIEDGAQFVGANSHLSFVGDTISTFNIESATEIFSVDTLSLAKEESSHELILLSLTRQDTTPFLDINNFLQVERGFLDYRYLPLRLMGDVENHDAIGNEFEPGRLILGGSDPQNIFMPINNNTAYFGRMEINNPAGVKLHNNYIPVIHNLILTEGVFDIRTFKVTVTRDITGDFGDDTHIVSTGNHSDGGLIRRIASDTVVEFPLGVYMGANARYAPLTANYVNVTEPVFVQVNTVGQELPTLANDDPDRALRMYWRIRHSDVTNIPDVNSYVFQHPDGMAPDTIPDNFVPGKVVNFDRFTEHEDNYNEAARSLTFDSGFPLEQGEYTAGHIDKFAGEVEVFYSRIKTDIDSPASWNEDSTWSFDGHNGDADTGGKIPQPGDLVQIGFSDPEDPESYHMVEIDTTVLVGGIIFHSDPSVKLPVLRLTGNIVVAPGNISGEGSVVVSMDGNTPSLSADLGDFNEGERSEFVYQASADSSYLVPDNYVVYPSLILKGPTSATSSFQLPDADLLIKKDFRIENNTSALLSTGTNGDLTIIGNLVAGNEAPVSNGELVFRATNNPRTVLVENDILLTGNTNSGIFVENVTSNSEHRLIAKRDIIQSAGNLDLFINGNTTRVILSLQGQQNSSYSRSGGNAPAFYQLVMNKGINQNYSFAFNDSFTLNPDASGAFKPIVLQHGILELNDAGIEVNLNTGDESPFYISPGSGLILSDAKAYVDGAKGISLNGLLKIRETGELIMTGSNAYIEYGNDGQATLEIHDNAELSVGGQIRRPENFNPAILSYRQTGGKVWVGTDAAPTINRGVFEVTENGSFRMTGGELFIVRGHNESEAEASFLLDPADFLLDEDATIYFGHSSTPGNNTLSIKSTRPLPNVIISGGNGFTAQLRSEPLTINGELHILSGKTFDTNQLDLFLKGDFINEGTFSGSGSTVTFNGVSQVKSGNTSFHNLVMNVDNNLSLGEGEDKSFTQLIVNGDLELLSGTLIDSGFEIDLKGNLVNHASHFSNETTGGIKFSGSAQQHISGNGSVGRLEINNGSGVRLNNSLAIENELVFTNGILDIQGQRLSLGAGSSITSPNGFSPDKMIKTSGTIAAAGVRIFISGTGDFLVPFGVTGKYTPVVINATQNPATPYLDIVPLNEMHVAIPPDDPNNLQYNWVVESNGLSTFKGELRFYYVQGDVEGAEEDYYPAWLSGEYWTPLTEGKVFEDDNYFIYDFPDPVDDITGDYTAGSEIPDRVLRFRTTGLSNDWTDLIAWENVPGNDESEEPVPSGGPRGNIIEIMEGHTIIVPEDERIAYRSFIDGTLELGATQGHYLGVVDGTGAVKLETASVPVGRYDNFAASGKGTFEYTGNNSFTVDPTYLPQDGHINKLIFSGTGHYNWPAMELFLFNNLEIREQAIFDNEDEVTITIQGDLILENDASFIQGFDDNARLIFAGTAEQKIVGNFTDGNRLNVLRLDNPQGLTIEGSTQIATKLELIKGNVRTSGDNVLRLLNTAQITGSSLERYIEGPLQKEGVGEFIFPVGNDGRRGRIAFVPNTSLPVGTILEAQYFPTTTPDYEQVEVPLERVSSLEYWQLESVVNKNTPNGKVHLYYEDIAFSHITDPGSLLIGRYTSENKWRDQGQSFYHTFDDNSGYIASGNIDGTGLFTFASDNSNFSNNPLPVELLSFTATVKGSEVLVEWATASETNNNFFTVERSRDGYHFETLGYVNGAGTVNEIRHYELYDSEPFTGISYYRLKQTDFDGSSEYVGLVAVQIRKDVASLMQVYPNPVRNGEVNVRISNMQPDETVTIHIMDLQGRLLLGEQVYADNTGTVLHRMNQLSGFPAGLYFVVVQSRISRITERIIIQ